jgi:peptide chain release factor 3
LATELSELQTEIETAVTSRRNFAIISHPDAGKTTLTEKLLLYGGAIHEAGAVKARRAQRHATSDWMEMEQQRGISITSTVLQFDYQGYQINLLDTPGHQDFSEDTYRTLAAADNAVMLVDVAKGLEPQTRKLFEVCKLRALPIFTFINKLDRPGRDALSLLDEIEQELGLQTYVVNWPIGQGDRFKGVYDRRRQQIHLFERTEHGKREAKETIVDLGDPQIEQLLDQDLYYQLKEEIELLDGLGPSLDLDLVHQGKMTPIFFGSAMTNFGVELFLDAFLDYALQPTAYRSTLGEIIPSRPEFSGFVFKLQANMDPKHRDRVAFVRVCSGKFEKDMAVQHARTGKTIRLSRPQKLFAQGRESIEAAYPGDVIGLNNPGVFAIGDTIYIGAKLEYEGIPCFSPELFAYLRNPNPSKFKSFQKGVTELREEGAVQIMYSADEAKREPILAAVGQLQFEVVQFRMLNEYGVETLLEPLPYSTARWVVEGWPALEAVGRIFNAATVKDSWGRPVLLFKNDWNVQQLQADHPKLQLSTIAPVVSGQQPTPS